MDAYDKFWDYVSSRKTEIGDVKREAQVKIDALTAERDVATAERDVATAERDAAEARADAVTAERDAAVEKLRQTARNLKALNLTTEQIAAATGLTAAEIEGL